MIRIQFEKLVCINAHFAFQQIYNLGDISYLIYKIDDVLDSHVHYIYSKNVPNIYMNKDMLIAFELGDRLP